MSEIFTKEDFNGISLSAYDSNEVRQIIAERACDILKERLEVRYTSILVDDDIASPHHWNLDLPSDKKGALDTHKIYYITEPIEEVKPKEFCCHNKYRWYLGAEDGKIHSLKNGFCPTCGDKLND
mgnify:CR=1 FL=1